ncbi:MAG: DJ-1/PfpI family protein [Lentisphaeria bacterium]|nr:DJ-1/PfpI family protein [Lentisphaeria bacterium]
MNVKTALVILADGFEEIEALGTADVLRRLKIRVLLTGLHSLSVTGSHHIKVTADATFDFVPFASSSAIILPGGLPGTTNLLESEELAERIRYFYSSGKVVAAICAAGTVLKHAGIAENKRLAGYPGSEDLANAPGFQFTGAMVERDGNIITGKAPGATFLFAAEIGRALGCSEDQIRDTLNGMFVPSV